MSPSRSTVSVASVVATTVLAGALAACGADSAKDGDRDLVVLAAASLTDVFEELAAEFESQHAGTDVTFSFGSSTDLAEQVADGAPGDVLATADEASMELAEDAGATGAVTPFATNVLTIVTRPDNPRGIETLDDLQGTTWVRCTDEAPCGKVAAKLLADNAITAEPASLEEDVRATLDKVVSGEADAGLVYATDAVAAGDDIEAIEITGAQSALTTYFVTVLEQSDEPELAQDWVDFVTSGEGLSILESAGFGNP